MSPLLFWWLFCQSNQTDKASKLLDAFFLDSSHTSLSTLHIVLSQFKYLDQRLFIASLRRWTRNVFLPLFFYILIWKHKKNDLFTPFLATLGSSLFFEMYLKLFPLIKLYFCKPSHLGYNLWSFSSVFLRRPCRFFLIVYMLHLFKRGFSLNWEFSG